MYQPDLFADSLTATAGHVDKLCSLLEHSPEPVPWRRLADLAHQRFGVRWDDRKLRTIAAESQGRIIGTRHGYILNVKMSDKAFAEYERYYRSMYLAGMHRVKVGKDFRYGRRQSMLEFITEGIDEESL